jgi:hypothetical protein
LIVDLCFVNLTKNERELLREFQMLPEISKHEKLIMPKANNYKHHCHFASGSLVSESSVKKTLFGTNIQGKIFRQKSTFCSKSFLNILGENTNRFAFVQKPSRFKSTQKEREKINCR